MATLQVNQPDLQSIYPKYFELNLLDPPLNANQNVRYSSLPFQRLAVFSAVKASRNLLSSSSITKIYSSIRFSQTRAHFLRFRGSSVDLMLEYERKRLFTSFLTMQYGSISFLWMYALSPVCPLLDHSSRQQEIVWIDSYISHKSCISVINKCC